MEKLGLNPKFFAVVLVAAATGCSQGTVGIGDQQPSAQQKTGLAAFAATWDGYVEAYTFQDNSDRVRIAISELGTGTIRFGNEDLWPRATDPNVKYPPSYPQYSAPRPTELPTVWDGVNYNFNGLRVEAERIRGSSWSKEVFGDWCALQTSNPTSPGQQFPYTCAPTCGDIVVGPPQQPGPSDTCYTFDPCPIDNPSDLTGANVPFPCERLELTLVCACDANNCTLTNASGTDDITLDAALEDVQQTMTGTLVLGGTNYTVRLKRQ